MTSLKTTTACIVACLAFATARPVAADDYALDDQHTSVVFAVNHFGYSYTYGMFGKYRGRFQLT